jgi:hypothetical protein
MLFWNLKNIYLLFIYLFGSTVVWTQGILLASRCSTASVIQPSLIWKIFEKPYNKQHSQANLVKQHHPDNYHSSSSSTNIRDSFQFVESFFFVLFCFSNGGNQMPWCLGSSSSKRILSFHFDDGAMFIKDAWTRQEGQTREDSKELRQ